MADCLDPDLIDGELALVLGTLDVGDDKRIADIHEEPFVALGSILEDFNMRPVPGLFNWRRLKIPTLRGSIAEGGPDARGRRRRCPPCPGRSKRAIAPGRRDRRSGRAARA